LANEAKHYENYRLSQTALKDYNDFKSHSNTINENVKDKDIDEKKYTWCAVNHCGIKHRDMIPTVYSLQINIDESCNLSCPSCRREPIMHVDGPEQFRDEDMEVGGEELFPSYDSDGNFLGMVKGNGNMEDGKEMYPEEKPAYEFDSPGAFGATNTFEGVENPEKVKDSIKESLNWFKRFSNFN
jgi:hypothetical protein